MMPGQLSPVAGYFVATGLFCFLWLQEKEDLYMPKKPEGPSTQAGAIHTWQCSACGHVCVRRNPPDKCPSCNKVLYKPDLPLEILVMFGNDYLFLDDVVKHKAVIIALERLFRRHGRDWIIENLEELREQASALRYF